MVHVVVHCFLNLLDVQVSVWHAVLQVHNRHILTLICCFIKKISSALYCETAPVYIVVVQIGLVHITIKALSARILRQHLSTSVLLARTRPSLFYLWAFKINALARLALGNFSVWLDLTEMSAVH